MKKFGIILAAAVALAACQQPQQQPMQFDQRASVEQEDCDTEDMLEGDEDCYGEELDFGKHKKKHKKAKPRSSWSKPSKATKSSWGSSSRSSFRSSGRRR